MIITVNLIAPFASDFMRQSLEGDGLWGDVRFLVNSLEPSDYCIVFNGVETPLEINCRPGNIWLMMQEPPTEFWKAKHRGNDSYDRIFTQDTDLVGSRYSWTQPATNWHVKRSYFELRQMPPVIKSRDVSAVVSNQAMFAGHRDRLAFLSRLKEHMSLDHFGKGFREIDDKWDALAPYRYSFTAENFRNPFYWTEKIADCFLARTMPIYCGCTRITDYFPAEAMICFDMNDPHAIDSIRNAIDGNAWGKNKDAIEYARELVLERYQLLPLLAEHVKSHVSSSGMNRNDFQIKLVRPVIEKPGLLDKGEKYLQRIANKMRGI